MLQIDTNSPILSIFPPFRDGLQSQAPRPINFAISDVAINLMIDSVNKGHPLLLDYSDPNMVKTSINMQPDFFVDMREFRDKYLFVLYIPSEEPSRNHLGIGSGVISDLHEKILPSMNPIMASVYTGYFTDVPIRTHSFSLNSSSQSINENAHMVITHKTTYNLTDPNDPPKSENILSKSTKNATFKSPNIGEISLEVEENTPDSIIRRSHDLQAGMLSDSRYLNMSFGSGEDHHKLSNNDTLGSSFSSRICRSITTAIQDARYQANLVDSDNYREGISDLDYEHISVTAASKSNGLSANPYGFDPEEIISLKRLDDSFQGNLVVNNVENSNENISIFDNTDNQTMTNLAVAWTRNIADSMRAMFINYGVTGSQFSLENSAIVNDDNYHNLFLAVTTIHGNRGILFSEKINNIFKYNVYKNIILPIRGLIGNFSLNVEGDFLTTMTLEMSMLDHNNLSTRLCIPVIFGGLSSGAMSNQTTKDNNANVVGHTIDNVCRNAESIYASYERGTL